MEVGPERVTDIGLGAVVGSAGAQNFRITSALLADAEAVLRMGSEADESLLNRAARMCPCLVGLRARPSHIGVCRS
jgi:hypothetical protein